MKYGLLLFALFLSGCGTLRSYSGDECLDACFSYWSSSSERFSCGCYAPPNRR
jgi:hypothetical protein